MNYEKTKEWLAYMLNEFHFEHKADRKSLDMLTLATRELYNNTNSFKTKEEYLELVKIWKDVYYKLSYECRQSKRCRKQIYDTSGINTLNARSYRSYATRLLDFRRDMKERAAEQYNAQKLVDMAA